MNRKDWLRVVALAWIVVASAWFAQHLGRANTAGPTALQTYAFGDVFIDFWAAARLALMGRVADVYDLAKFHDFQVPILDGPIHLYHYDYPPIMILVTLPFALLPYFWGLAAWFVGGLWVFAATVRATWPRGMRRRGDIALYALAVPAVYANAVTGQTGTWMAAIFGGGLMAIERRPMLAGALLGLLSAKPQMALLVPVALLSARRWTALIAFSAVCAVLTAATAWLFGIDVWGDFAGRVSLVRRSVLEAGIGLDTDVTTWNIFISVFVMIRALPASVAVAYAVQGAAGLIAVSLVIAAWRSAGPQNAKNAVLVMAAFFATPYVQLYDLVVATLVPLWLVLSVPADDARQTAAWLAAIPLLLAPLAAPALYRLTGYATGCLWLVPAFAVAVRSCLRCARPGRYSSAACPDGISASSIRLRIWRKPRPVP